MNKKKKNFRKERKLIKFCAVKLKPDDSLKNHVLFEVTDSKKKKFKWCGFIVWLIHSRAVINKTETRKRESESETRPPNQTKRSYSKRPNDVFPYCHQNLLQIQEILWSS